MVDLDEVSPRITTVATQVQLRFSLHCGQLLIGKRPLCHLPLVQSPTGSELPGTQMICIADNLAQQLAPIPKDLEESRWTLEAVHITESKTKPLAHSCLSEPFQFKLPEVLKYGLLEDSITARKTNAPAGVPLSDFRKPQLTLLESCSSLMRSRQITIWHRKFTRLKIAGESLPPSPHQMHSNHPQSPNKSRAQAAFEDQVPKRSGKMLMKLYNRINSPVYREALLVGGRRGQPTHSWKLKRPHDRLKRASADGSMHNADTSIVFSSIRAGVGHNLRNMPKDLGQQNYRSWNPRNISGQQLTVEP